MKKLLSKWFLFLTGWKIKGEIPAHISKCIILAAPHTSNKDFLIGRLAFYVMNLRICFLIKKEAFKFPVAGMLRRAGGIAVDRSGNNNTVNEIVELFNSKDKFYLAITPEGTRKKVEKWKMGFYHIAQLAKVPIVLAYVDYKKKEGGIGPVINISGNKETDLRLIFDFYKNITPKYPEQFNLFEKSDKVKNEDPDFKSIKQRYCCRR